MGLSPETLALGLPRSKNGSLRLTATLSSIPAWFRGHFADAGWAPTSLLAFLVESGLLKSLKVREAIVSFGRQTVVWLPDDRDEACSVIGKFTQGSVADGNRLTRRLIIDQGELDFLVRDTHQSGTLVGSSLSPFSRPFCLRSLQLFDCLVVTLALFIEVRAFQHGEQVVRPQECQGVHHGATNKHCYARHYFRISAGMSPCLISMSLVAMARATSTTTMPTSRGVKSSFGGLPPIAILPSRAYPAAGPETTALWYSALTSILPSVAGVVMVLFHIVGVGASLQLDIWTLASGPAAIDAGLARKRMFSPAKI